MTRLGHQIPNFTYPGVGSDSLFEVVAAQAVEAEESGFDTACGWSRSMPTSQHHLPARRDPPQARGPRPVLRGAGSGPLRDHRDLPDQCGHRPDP
jgi:hypothetical protein